MAYSETLGKNEISEEIYEKEIEDNKHEDESDESSIFEDVSTNDFGSIDISSDDISGIVNFGSGSIKNITNYYNILQKSEIGSYWTIKEERINKINGVYAEFSNYKTAINVLNDRNFMILYDGINTGKFTSAIYLLSKIHGFNIIEYDNEIDLKEIINIELKPDFGYVIDKLPAEIIENSAIKYTFIDAVCKKLKELNSHLVITLNSNTIRNDFLKEYAIKYTGIKDHIQMLKKYIYYSIKNEKTADEIINKIDFTINKDLVNEISPEECDKISEKLFELHNKELNVCEAFNGLKNAIRKEIDIWFKNNVELEQRLLMVALSVLSGSEFRIVYTACEDLKKIIFHSEKGNEHFTVDLIFGKPVYVRAEEICSRIVKRVKKTEYGQSEFNIIEFQKSEFEYSVLEYIWNEYDYFQKYLIKWLFKYGNNEDIKIAEHVALAVSELLKYDFEYIISIIKQQWIEGKSFRARGMAAKALIYYCKNENSFIRVSKLVDNWTYKQNSNSLLWVSAFVYGNIGITIPDVALEHLSTIALKGTSLNNVITVSILRIFNYGYTYPENYIKVLCSLVNWTEPHQSSILYNIGVQVFLKIIKKSYFPYYTRINDNYNHLLSLMKNDTKYINSTTKLWDRVLRDDKYKREAVDELINWIKYADKNINYFYVVRNLLYDLVINEGQIWLLNLLEQMKQTLAFAQKCLYWLKMFMVNPVLEDRKIEYKFYFIPLISYPKHDQSLVLRYSNRYSMHINNQLSVIQSNARLKIWNIIFKKYYQSFLFDVNLYCLEFAFVLENINCFLKIKLNYQICKPDIFINKVLKLNSDSNVNINPCKIIRDLTVLLSKNILDEENCSDVKLIKEKQQSLSVVLQERLLNEGIKISDVEIVV